MSESKAEIVVLSVLEAIGLMVALYGIWHHYIGSASASGIFYTSVWYFFGGFAHLFGLISIVVERYEDEAKGDSQAVLQFHYMAGWLSMVVGYPLLVTYTWTNLYPTTLAQAHFLLIILPLLAMVGRSQIGIILSTQICSGIAAASHLFICAKGGEMFGLVSSIIAAINIVAFSLPTKYHVWELNSRELFIAGLVAMSALMTISIDNLNKPEHKIKALF